MAEKEEKIAQLEEIQAAIKETFEIRLSEKEEQYDQLKKDNEAYIA